MRTCFPRCDLPQPVTRPPPSALSRSHPEEDRDADRRRADQDSPKADLLPAGTMLPVEVEVAFDEKPRSAISLVHHLPAEVDDLGFGQEMHRPAGERHTMAPVDLVAVYEEALVEPSDLLDDLAPNHHACAVDPTNRLGLLMIGPPHTRRRPAFPRAESRTSSVSVRTSRHEIQGGRRR